MSREHGTTLDEIFASPPATVVLQFCPTDCLAVQITMLFWGFKKSWLSAFNREQNAATVDDLGSM